MGARANIVCKFEDGNKIYFYSHWDGEGLEEVLKEALKRGQDRWDDSPYLARIIFSQMIKDKVMSNTSYGISPYFVDEDFPPLEVDFSEQSVNGIAFKEFISV